MYLTQNCLKKKSRWKTAVHLTQHAIVDFKRQNPLNLPFFFFFFLSKRSVIKLDKLTVFLH